MRDTESTSSAPQGKVAYIFNKDRNKRGSSVKRVQGKGTLLLCLSPLHRRGPALQQEHYCSV